MSRIYDNPDWKSSEVVAFCWIFVHYYWRSQHRRYSWQLSA